MLGARVTTLPIPDGTYFIRNQISQKVLELGDNDIVLLRSVAEHSHKAGLFTPQCSCSV
jgi:hypothetical protein